MAFDSFRDFLNAAGDGGRIAAHRAAGRHRAGDHRDRRPRDEEARRRPGAAGGEANGERAGFALSAGHQHARFASAHGDEPGGRFHRRGGGRAGLARESQAADQFQGSHQPAGHGPRPAPRQAEAGQGRPVQGGRPQVRRPAHARRAVAQGAGHSQSGPGVPPGPAVARVEGQAGRLPHFAEPAHPTVLAAGWRAFHHAAVRGDARPRYRRAQRGHVPDAGL